MQTLFSDMNQSSQSNGTLIAAESSEAEPQMDGSPTCTCGKGTSGSLEAQEWPQPRERPTGSRGNGIGWWTVEPGIRRVVDGIPDRAHRIKALGNAQGYATQAQANAENYAQGAANQAQTNAEQFAASGIAAALAMPSSPVLNPGQVYVGTEMGSYDGQQAVGAKMTYQISRRWNANVGVSGGFGQYGHTAVAAGVGYTFGN